MRKLSIRKETLSEITAAELVEVVGGITGLCPHQTLTCNGPCHSDFQECITGLRCVSVTGC